MLHCQFGAVARNIAMPTTAAAAAAANGVSVHNMSERTN